MQTSDDVARIPARATKALIADALAAAGLPQPDAARCAELMSEADLTGADGHGIFRLPQYVRRLKAGGFNKRPNITVSRTRAGDRAGRWRQRHGAFGDVARGERSH